MKPLSSTKKRRVKEKIVWSRNLASRYLPNQKDKRLQGWFYGILGHKGRGRVRPPKRSSIGRHKKAGGGEVASFIPDAEGTGLDQSTAVHLITTGEVRACPIKSREKQGLSSGEQGIKSCERKKDIGGNYCRPSSHILWEVGQSKEERRKQRNAQLKS